MHTDYKCICRPSTKKTNTFEVLHTKDFVKILGMKTLAERLRHALEVTGVSQSELARRVGVKPQAVQYICSGKGQKSGYTTEFARALGINPDWLANGTGPMFQESITPEERALLEKYRQMAEQDRKTLQEVGAALASKGQGKGQVGNDSAQD